METDPKVLKYLAENLAGKPESVIERFSHRIAVFSDNPEILNIGEVQLKSRLWKHLDEAISNGITTIYTGLNFGGDSAAAELFADRKQQNPSIRIVHVAHSRQWIQKLEPQLKGFAVNTLIRNTDFMKTIDGGAPETSGIIRDHFIIDQCLHLVFILDMADSSEDSYSWQLFDYATRSHKNSISHQIHIICCSDAKPQQPTCKQTGEPFQSSLF